MLTRVDFTHEYPVLQEHAIDNYLVKSPMLGLENIFILCFI